MSSLSSILPLILGQANQPKATSSTDAKLANTFVFLQANGSNGKTHTIKNQQDAYKLAFNALISDNKQQAGLMLQLASLSTTDFNKIAALSNDNGANLAGISVVDLLALSQKGATSTGFDIAKDDFDAAGVTTTTVTKTKAELKALGNGETPPTTTTDNNDIFKKILLLSLLGGGGGIGGAGGSNPLLLLLLLGGQGGLGGLLGGSSSGSGVADLW